MKSLSRRAKIIIGIVLGVIVVTGGVLVYLQRTGKISIFAATVPITVTPRNVTMTALETKEIRVTPAKSFRVTCLGYFPDSSTAAGKPLKTVEIVGGTEYTKYNSIGSQRYFPAKTSSFSVKALSEGKAICKFNFYPKTGQIRVGDPYSVTINIRWLGDIGNSGSTTTGGGTTGGSGATTITLDPTSLNLHKGTYQAVYLPAAAAPVVTVQCSGEASVWNGSADVAKATFRDNVTTEKNELNAVSIKAGRNVGSGTCLFYLSADAAVSPAATLPVTSYD